LWTVTAGLFGRRQNRVGVPRSFSLCPTHQEIIMNRNELGRPIEILLVEDNPGDAELTAEALRQGKVCNQMHLVEDGEAALAFLRRQDNMQAYRVRM